MGVLSRVIFDPDTTPPTTPASVTATALSQTAIRITWTASTDTGGSGLAGYRVFRATTSGGTYTQFSPDLSTASLTLDDVSLTAGATRFYRVAAFDGNGNQSALSNIVSATTQSGSQPVVIARLPFTDGFESGSTSAWDFQGGSMPTTTAEAYLGTRSSMITAVGGGTPNDNYLEKNFGDAFTVGGTPTGMQDLWIRVAHKWSSNWADNGYASVQKVFLLNTHNPASGRRRFQLTFNLWTPGNEYFCEFLRWNEDGSGNGITNANVFTGATRVLGEWIEFVLRVRMNTPGASDGILQIWSRAEGSSTYTQRVDRSNINYRDSTAFTPNRLVQSNYQPDGTPSGTRYWDAWQLQQEAIDVSSSVTAPAVGDSNVNFANNTITGSPAILDLRQNYGVAPRSNIIWLGGVERRASYTYVTAGGYYGQGCARFVPGRFTSDPVGNPRGDHPGGIGQLLGFNNVSGGSQVVTVGILWRHGSTLLSESDGIKSLILLRGGGPSTRPMIIPKGDWTTTGSGGGTVVLPPCDGTLCNARETAAANGADNYYNDPPTALPDISGPWAQWVWTEASLNLTVTPSIFWVRSWFADGSEQGTHILKKNLWEGSGGFISGLDIIGYYNSINSPTSNCFLEVERVEVHVGQFGPITPPRGFPGSTR